MQNFMLISNPKKQLRKSTQKKLFSKNIFRYGHKIFYKNSFNNFFLVHFSSIFLKWSKISKNIFSIYVLGFH